MMGLRSKKPYRRWSHEESERLLQLFELHPLGTTARKLNLSTSSVESMLIRLGVTAQMYKDSFTKHLLASLLHIRPAVVQKWIDTGMLKARREGTTTLPRMIIEAEDFTRFCKTHPEAILRGHVRQDRLEFVFKFVFPAATWIYCR
jgi:hypothetical protein